MKNYKATDHAKLNSEHLRNQFTKFMLNEYNPNVNNGDSTEQTALVIEPEKAIFQAHDDDDFDWFVSEFMKDLKRRERKVMRMWNKELRA